MARWVIWSAPSRAAVRSALPRSLADSKRSPASWSDAPGDSTAGACVWAGAFFAPAYAGAARPLTRSVPASTRIERPSRFAIRVIIRGSAFRWLRLDRDHRHGPLGSARRDLDGLRGAQDLTAVRVVHHELIAIRSVQIGRAHV